MARRHPEDHRTARSGWLRAGVLGANDGVLSVAGLVVGVAATGASTHAIVASGVAGVVAGAFSMAAGEYVSVQSQADVERADVRSEARELHEDPAAELNELTGLYVARGLTPDVARTVAEQLTARGALEAHTRDELGITETLRARPVQASLASAGAFAVGALLPLAAAGLAPRAALEGVTTAATVVALAALGAFAAGLGGASKARGALRVGLWGAVALAAASALGRAFGAVL